MQTALAFFHIFSVSKYYILFNYWRSTWHRTSPVQNMNVFVILNPFALHHLSTEDGLMRLFYEGMCIPPLIYWCNDAPCVRGDAVQIYPVHYHWHGGVTKAVDRGDKRTRRLRVRVLALRENPWRVRVRGLALLENPQRDRVLEPALRENPRRERVLDRWFEARDFSVDILILVPWIKERGRGCPLMGHEPRTMDLYGTKFNKWKI